MTEFLKLLETRGDCGECSLVPVLPWYRDALQEGGRMDLAEQIQALAKVPSLTGEDLARTLDTIKTQVDGSLRAQLSDFDCAAQEAILHPEGGE